MYENQNYISISQLRERLLADDSGGGYPKRLALEEMLLADGSRADEVADLIQDSGWIASGPFNSLTFTLYRKTGQEIWLQAFMYEAIMPLLAKHVSAEGAWTHSRGKYGDGHAMLIDSFQEEASAVIKLSWLMRRGDVEDLPRLQATPEELEHRAVEQFLIYRSILRDPQTGLWHNGRGWLPCGDVLSPGFWSRGHGWLLRGLCEAMDYLPGNAPGRGELAAIARELAESLMVIRHSDGMWTALLNQPDSPPESSGSAMITGSLFRLIRNGTLDEERYIQLVLRSVQTLLRDYLDEQGHVLHACHGPGPLVSIEDYTAGNTYPPDNPHGVAAFLYLARVLEQSTTKSAKPPAS